MPEALPRRQDVPDEKKWSIESVFPNTEAWEAEYARVDGQTEGFTAYQGRLGESAATLADALAREDEAGMAAYKVYLYASMLRAGGCTPVSRRQRRFTSRNCCKSRRSVWKNGCPPAPLWPSTGTILPRWTGGGHMCGRKKSSRCWPRCRSLWGRWGRRQAC